MQNKNGYTLVEVSIVLLVLGITLVGFLKGQQILMHGRVVATIKEVQSWRSAYESFYDKYGYLPGDMPTATTELKNCVAADNCADGNGDNITGILFTDVDQEHLWYWDQTGAEDPSLSWDDAKEETTQFFKHLQLGEFISGQVQVAAPYDPAQWGVTHPSAAFGGGWQVLHMNTEVGSGHFIRFQNAINGWDPTSAAGRAPMMVISPRYAWEIDRKLDDGFAGQSGSVWSTGSPRSGGADFCTDEDYSLSMTESDGPVCMLMFKLD